jgi:hypothetical protein
MRDFNMSYLEAAFGGFNPRVDRDAAVKFALVIILMDERLSDLSCLLTDGHEVGGVEGDPGWIIERRDTGPSGNMPYYADWPKTAHFYVHVDPSGYDLAHPEMFMEISTFHDYVRKGIEAYVAKNPSKVDMAEPVISLL